MSSALVFILGCLLSLVFVAITHAVKPKKPWNIVIGSLMIAASFFLYGHAFFPSSPTTPPIVSTPLERGNYRLGAPQGVKLNETLREDVFVASFRIEGTARGTHLQFIPYERLLEKDQIPTSREEREELIRAQATNEVIQKELPHAEVEKPQIVTISNQSVATQDHVTAKTHNTYFVITLPEHIVRGVLMCERPKHSGCITLDQLLRPLLQSSTQ